MEVLTPTVEKMATYIQRHIEIVSEHTLFWKLMGGWFNDTQNAPMVGAEYQKIIDAWFIYQKTFVSFGNIFVSEVFADYFISF